MIYFVGAASGEGLIKIGHTGNPFAQRIEGLQRGSPVPLIVLAVIDGDLDGEHELHERFETERIYGEWFLRCPALLAVIEAARKTTPAEWLDYRRPERPQKIRQPSPAARKTAREARSLAMENWWKWWRQQEEATETT